MILSIFPSARAEVVTGLATAGTGFFGHLSWINDIFPLISEIAVIAGCIVAVHGVYTIVTKEYRDWKTRRHNYGSSKDIDDKKY